MSVNATKWAWEQNPESISTKLLLLAIADAADGETGMCWPSQDFLAKATLQSTDTVQRGLKRLEKLGLIFRSARRWEDSGRWRANLTVVLFDDNAVAFALQHGFDPQGEEAAEPEKGASEGEDSTIPQSAAWCKNATSENNDLAEENGVHAANCGMDQAANCGMDRTALLRYGYNKDRTQTKEPISPLNPLPSANPPLRVKGSWQADWEVLLGLWPWAEGETSEKARNKFRDMPPDDRAGVIKAAEIYLANRRDLKQPIMKGRAFLDEAAWRRWLLSAKGGDGKSSPKAPGAPQFVAKDTDAWFAWLRHKNQKSLPTVWRTINGRRVEGWVFPSLFPPRSGEPPPSACAAPAV